MYIIYFENLLLNLLENAKLNIKWVYLYNEVMSGQRDAMSKNETLPF